MYHYCVHFIYGMLSRLLQGKLTKIIDLGDETMVYICAFVLYLE